MVINNIHIPFGPRRLLPRIAPQPSECVRAFCVYGHAGIAAEQEGEVILLLGAETDR
jgi:hypothetical protein